MEDWGKIWVASFLGLILILSLCFVSGLFEIGYMKTIEVEKENTRREIFEHSNSYIRGKEAEALKLYNEHRLSSDKKSVEAIVKISFKDFDETQLNSEELEVFVSSCKYK